MWKTVFNFIPHETIACDDKDPPRFNINEIKYKIKTLIQVKNTVFNSFRTNSGNFELHCHLEILQEHLNAPIQSFQKKYYYQIANKLNNTTKTPKVTGCH